jgi:predicted small secreted protein
MMKKRFLLALAGLFLLSMAGCGTIKGIGEDVSAVGGWMSKSSDTVKSPESGNTK